MRRTRLLLTVALTAAVTHQSSPAAATCATTGADVPGVAAQVTCVTLHPGSPLYVVMPDSNRSCAAGFLYADGRGGRYVAVPSRCVYEPVCTELVEIDLPIPPPPPLPQPLPGLVEEVKRLLKLLVCVEQPSGQEERFGRNAPVVFDGAGRRVGVVAYAVDKPEARFGLVRLDAGVAASAAVPYFGGPTGTDTSRTDADVVRIVSPPQPLTPGVPLFNARLALSVFRAPANRFSMYAPTAVSLTNYGGVVTTADGLALGQVESYDYGYLSVVGVRPATVVARSAKVARIDLKLATAPLAG